MDVVKWLETLLGDCRLVSSAEEALALVPSLGLDAPHTQDIPLEGESPWRGSPVGFAKVLRQPLGMMVAEAMTEVTAGQAPSDPSQLSLDVLANDAATATLARLLIEAWRSGPRSASLVMLETVRQAAAIAWGDFDELTRYSPASAARARRALEDMPDRLKVRTEYLQGLAWALSVRLGGAWALAASLDPSVRPTRLYQALVANRLVLVAPAGALSPTDDLDLVAGVLGIEVDEGVLGATHLAVCAVLKVALAGGGDAAGAALRSLAGTRNQVASLALDPRVIGLALQALPDLVDTKQLKGAGVSKSAQKRLLKREGASAAGALYGQAARALRAWDVLGALASRCLPVELEGGAWTSRLGRVQGQLPWPLLTPRGDGGQADLTVVGVRLDGLWETVRKHAVDQGEPLVLAAAQGLWRGVCSGATEHGGFATSLGSDGLGFFASKSGADKWAEAVRSAFRPPLRLGLGPFGDGVNLPSGGAIDVNIASGRCVAGWDGEHLWAAGDAVARALPGGGGGLSDDQDEGLEGLAAMAADTGGGPDPFGGDSPGGAPAQASGPSFSNDDDFDPFAASVSPDEPEAPAEDPADDYDAFDEDEPLGAAPDVDFAEDVPQDDADDAFYLPPPPEGEAAPDPGADEGLYMLPPPTEEELAASEPEPVEGTFMLPPPTDQELQDHQDSGAVSDGGYEIEDDEDSEVDDEDQPLGAPAEDDPFAAFEVADGDSVEVEDSEAEFAAMEGGAGFRFSDDQAAGAADFEGAEETFKFETPVFEPEGDEGGGGFSLTERRGSSKASKSSEPGGDVWASANGPDPEIEAAGGDLFDEADEASGLEDSDAPASPATLGLGMADLRYLFDGYVHYLDGQSGMVFGRRYGDRVLDRHVYEFQGDKDKVYRQFLLDKVEEGFVPRTDLVGDLPAGIEPEGIDLERMGAVAQQG